MDAVSGICPSCREEGAVGTACPEKGCKHRGYHRIPHAMLADVARLDPEIGLLLDRRYLLVKTLGEGGFGRVFVALQQPLGMKVALKLLKKDLDAEAHATRMRLFTQEAQAMAQLQHPNIVKLVDFGFYEGAAYIVMELVEDGRTLKDEVKARAREERDLTLAEVEAILTGVLSGLEKAHGRGIIHRDIKPENIMLQVEPGHPFLPRLLDFGLAKFVDAGTLTSKVLGTPMYMAPEQLTKSDAGPWTDLYALGVIAYELMTGRRPFAGEVGEIIAAKRSPSFDVLAAVSDLAVPEPIGAFLRRALSFGAADRFRRAVDFRVAMQQAFHAAESAGDDRFASIDVTALARASTSQEGVAKPSRAGLPAPASQPAPPLTGVLAAATDFEVAPPPEQTRGLSRDELLAAPAPRRAATVRPASSPPPPAGAVAEDSPPRADHPLAPSSRRARWVGVMWMVAFRLVQLVQIAFWSTVVGAVGAGVVVLVNGLAELMPQVDEPEATPPDQPPQAQRRLGVEGSYQLLRDLLGERVGADGDEPGYVRIAPGVFTMGSPESEAGRRDDEVAHEVRITRGFWLKATEVTQGEWRAVMGNNPSLRLSCGDTCPVEGVSWYDAVAYLNALSRREGLEPCYEVSGCTGTAGDGCSDWRKKKGDCAGDYQCSSVTFKGLGCTGYRLPTEAEWEYAARAGTTDARYGALDGIAWYGDNSGRKTHPVAQKAANAWGLYDMLGNVWEWVQDWYGPYRGDAADPTGPSSGDDRVLRGGSWLFPPDSARAADRGTGAPPADRTTLFGFRPARSIP